MDKDKQEDEFDQEYEDIKKKTPGLNEEEDPEKPEEKEEKEKPKEDPEKDKKPQKEEKKSKSDEDEEDDSKDEEDVEDDKPKRPEKYIPIKQYTDEKKTWRETEESYKKRIGELEKIADTSNRGSQISEDKIKAYAAKHGLEVNVAKAELERVRDAQETLKGNEPEKKLDDKKPELDEETKARIEKAEAIEAEQMFDKEFTDLAEPKIKEFWPDANSKQIKEAKDLIAKKATTKEFIHYDLEYVVYKSQKELAKVFSKGNKGPENGRRSEHGDSEFTASDFKDGKTSFETLVSLSADEQSKIIEEMDVATYDKYCRFIERTDPITINRGGKRIKN